MDVVSYTKVMPHYLIAKAMLSASATALALMAFLENATSWGPTIITALAPIIASMLTFAAVVAKLRYDRWKDQQTAQHATHSADAQSLLDREKFADERMRQFITEMKALHSEQVKGLQSTIELMKELSQQDRALRDEDKRIITEQRTLISQQAAELQGSRGKQP